MKIFSETDLILNADGSVYHLHLLPHHIADTIVVVGDPDRVPLVSKYFDSIEYQIHKREFVTHTGYLNGKKITVISSGMGTDNVEILMNELDALVNIDLKTRTEKAIHTELNIIRIGTSGSIQADIPIDSILMSESAIGIDGLNDFYSINESASGSNICLQLKNQLNLRVQPYCVGASPKLLTQFGVDSQKTILKGLTLTLPGFYAPQGRTLRYESKIVDLMDRLQNFKTEGGAQITNLEMETAGYYLFGQILGHNMLSLNAILANRIINQFSQSADIQVDKLIKYTLGVICNKDIG